MGKKIKIIKKNTKLYITMFKTKKQDIVDYADVGALVTLQARTTLLLWMHNIMHVHLYKNSDPFCFQGGGASHCCTDVKATKWSFKQSSRLNLQHAKDPRVHINPCHVQTSLATFKLCNLCSAYFYYYSLV